MTPLPLSSVHFGPHLLLGHVHSYPPGTSVHVPWFWHGTWSQNRALAASWCVINDYIISSYMLYVYNINWSDVQRKIVVNNEYMSNLRAPWQNGLYKIKQTVKRKNTQNTKTQQTFRKTHTIFVSYWMFRLRP